MLTEVHLQQLNVLLIEDMYIARTIHTVFFRYFDLSANISILLCSNLSLYPLAPFFLFTWALTIAIAVANLHIKEFLCSYL